MSKVLVTKEKLDSLANSVAAKSGVPVLMSIDEMGQAVDSIVRPEGKYTINENGTYDIARYETVQVNTAPVIKLTTATVKSTTQSQVVRPESGYNGFSKITVQPISANDTYVVPSSEAQILYPQDEGYDYYTEVYVAPVPWQYVIPTGTNVYTGCGRYNVSQFEYAKFIPYTTSVSVTPAPNDQELIPGTLKQTFTMDQCSSNYYYDLDLSDFVRWKQGFVIGSVNVSEGGSTTKYDVESKFMLPDSGDDTVYFMGTSTITLTTSNRIKFSRNVKDVNLRFYLMNYDGYHRVNVNAISLNQKTVTPSESTQIIIPGGWQGYIHDETTRYCMVGQIELLYEVSGFQVSYAYHYTYHIYGTIQGYNADTQEQIDVSIDTSREIQTATILPLSNGQLRCFNGYVGYIFAQGTGNTNSYISYIDLHIDRMDYTGLSQVTVNPIPPQYIIPNGTLNVTSNGVIDVSRYQYINVNVTN